MAAERAAKAMRAQRPVRRRLRWAIGLGVAALAVFGQSLYEWVRLSARERQLDRQLTAVTAQHERLAQEQQRLQSDPAYVEGLIRSTFKLAQPGEYVIPIDSNQQSSR